MTPWSHAGCSCLCIKVLQKLDLTERNRTGEVNYHRSSPRTAPRASRMWRHARYHCHRHCYTLAPSLSLPGSIIHEGKNQGREITPPHPPWRSDKEEKPGLPTSLIFSTKSAKLVTAHAWHLMNEKERRKCIDILNSVPEWLLKRWTRKIVSRINIELLIVKVIKSRSYMPVMQGENERLYRVDQFAQHCCARGILMMVLKKSSHTRRKVVINCFWQCIVQCIALTLWRTKLSK